LGSGAGGDRGGGVSGGVFLFHDSEFNRYGCL
jgi:hypothetical protein